MKIEQLSILMHNGRRLISDLSFSLNPGDKLAIIGEEGNGKSSLLHAIIRPNGLDYAKVTGRIYLANQTLGLLEQQFSSAWYHRTTLEYLLTDRPGEEIKPERYNELSDIVKYWAQVGLGEELIDQPRPIMTLSGGEKVKLRLVKLLKQEPDILLLDEPTNDLDLTTLEWLEEFVREQTRPVLFISHDIVFLERTANRILHLENVRGKQADRHTLYTGGYQTYVKTRQRHFEKQDQLHGSQQRRLREQLIELNDQKNKVRSAQNKNKDSAARRIMNKKMANIIALKGRIDAADRVEKPVLEEAISFVLPKVDIPRSKRVIELHLPRLSVAGKVLTGPIDFTAMGGEAVCIVGENGVGKTTLLRRIEQTMKTDPSLQVASFPQTYREEFLAGETAMEYLARHVSDLTTARLQLGSIRLTYEEMERPVLSLSSGQQAKVILAKLVLLGANVIVADEPTRNVSPLSAPVIHELFSAYGGSLIMVSHDRRFIERVADRVLELSRDGLREL